VELLIELFLGGVREQTFGNITIALYNSMLVLKVAVTFQETEKQ